MRARGKHVLNHDSSRSHAVFSIHYAHVPMASVALDKLTEATLQLVDLAGSERASKMGAEGQMKREAAYVNKSLLALE